MLRVVLQTLLALDTKWIFVSGQGLVLQGFAGKIFVKERRTVYLNTRTGLWNTSHASFVISLTSHTSFPEGLASDESFLKWSLSNDNSQTGLLSSHCHGLEQKHLTRKKLPRCWSQELAASLCSQTQTCFETTSEANKCVFVRNMNFFFFLNHAVLTVYQLGTFSDRGSWIYHNLEGL